MEQTNNLFSKKNILIFLVVAIIMISIPLGVYLVQRQTQLKSKAQEAAEPIKFTGTGVECPTTTGDCTTTSTSVDVLIKAPLPPESAVGGTGGGGNGGGSDDD